MKITRDQLREMVKQQIEERCQKGYKTHEKRKTKKMFGKQYRNCVKAESNLKERSGVHSDESKRAEAIIIRHLKQMFDEIGRENLPKKFSTEILVQPILDKWVQGRRS